MAYLHEMDLADSRAKYIWVVLQCHIVFRDFISIRFDLHPETVAKTSLFMLNQRVDPSQLEKLESRMDAVESSVNKIKGTVTQVENTVNELKRKLNDFNHQLQNLKNRKE